MKVIKNNCIEDGGIEHLGIDFPFKTECCECGSEVLIDKDDLHIGWLGAQYFTCPCCGEEAMIDDIEGIKLTVDNIQFPTHFLRVNKNERRVKESSIENILSNIKKAVLHLREHKEEYAVVVGSGDTMVHVYRYDGDEEYNVIVSKDFYETYIPFEESDYMDKENI